MAEQDLPFRSPMTRNDDPDTSRGAADVVRPELGKIQRLVLEVFGRHGAMTARSAERRSEFYDYGFSTIRKRISELAQAGLLVEVGVDTTRRAPCTIYAVTSTASTGTRTADQGHP